MRGCFNTDSDLSSPCPHTGDCTVRPVWLYVEDRVSQVLEQITVADLLNEEGQVRRAMTRLWPLPPKPAACEPSLGAAGRAAV